MDAKGYRIKSFLTEIRYPACFRINSDIWGVLDAFPPEGVGFLASGGVSGTSRSESTDYAVEFNRAHYLVENIENPAQLDDWVRKSSKLLNHVINHWQIPVLERVGVRLHFMLADEGEHDQAHYAAMLGQDVDVIRSGVVTDKVFTGGWVFRFRTGDWGIRFGSFSSDAEVMQKYHRFNFKNSVFVKPGLVYDIDCYKTKVSTGNGAGRGDAKFDVSTLIRDAHALAEGLVRKHVERMKPVGK